MTPVRGPHRRGGHHLGGCCNRHDLVAGAAETRPERSQDVRLVVDDENARARHASVHVTVAG